MLMSPNKDETAVHGSHYRDDMAVRMPHRGVGSVCFSWFCGLLNLTPSPPPKKKEKKRERKQCITIVFDLSWDDCNTQEKLETMVMQNLEVNKMHYGLCENGE